MVYNTLHFKDNSKHNWHGETWLQKFSMTSQIRCLDGSPLDGLPLDGSPLDGSPLDGSILNWFSNWVEILKFEKLQFSS